MFLFSLVKGKWCEPMGRAAENKYWDFNKIWNIYKWKLQNLYQIHSKISNFVMKQSFKDLQKYVKFKATIPDFLLKNNWTLEKVK